MDRKTNKLTEHRAKPGHRALGLLLTLALLLAAFPVWAESQSARVVMKRGAVTAVDDETLTPRLLRRDSRVEAGETIVTGPKGLVQLVFPDKSLLYIKADSKVKIEAYRFVADKPEEDDVSVRLFKGAMRSLTGAVGKRNADAVKYHTRVSTIGIRGTATEVSDENERLRVTFDFGRGYVEQQGATMNMAEGASALSEDGRQAPSPLDFTRSSEDPASIARELSKLSPEEIAAWIRARCGILADEQEGTLLLGMEGQAPNAADPRYAATAGGLTTCLEVTGIAQVLTAGTLLYPSAASNFLEESVGAGLDVSIGLESVMRGLEDPSPDALNQVIDSALALGITTEQAQRVFRNLQENGICR